MNKQEFQQNIKDMKPTNYINSINSINSITIYDAYNEGFEEAKQNVLFGSDFLDEPEKPAVPQYVADMIIEKKKKYGIVDVIKNLGVFNNPFDLVVEKQLNWIVENQEDFVKAWLYGYEIEKEKLYTVELPNPNSLGFCSIILRRDNKGKVYISFSVFNRETWRGDENAQLTEAEIKKDFAWAWQFAEVVEEC